MTKKETKKFKKIKLTFKDIYDYLYPILEDPQFNIKLASKKEFLIHNMMVKLNLVER